MKRTILCLLLFAIAGCAPYYVWGSEQRIEKQLLTMVPLGSSLAALEAQAERRGWVLDYRNFRSAPAGAKTYFDDHHRECRSRGGEVLHSIIAHYHAPIGTYVDAMWLFDANRKLAKICVRKDFNTL